jgi:hypothetical protein
LLPQRCIGKGLKRLVQVDELMRDPREPFLVVKPSVQRVHLAAESVEPVENGIELPVVEMIAFGRHAPILTFLVGGLDETSLCRRAALLAPRRRPQSHR